MKPILIIVAVALFAGTTNAQTPKPYWVIENNQVTKDYTIVRIYDGNHNLIHEETLKGKFLQVSNRKDRKFLDRMVKSKSRHVGLASNKK